MPLEDSINLIKQMSRDMEATEDVLEESLQARDSLNRELDNARKRLKTKREGTKYPENLARETIKEMKDSKNIFLLGTMVDSIDTATEDSHEFDNDVYKTALYDVAKERDIYHLTTIGTGWNISLFVNIVFESEAGNLGEWARGVSSYRDLLGIDIEEEGSRRGERATVAFENKVFGTDLYNATLLGRLSYSGRKAPFWQILNNGSQPLLSDRPDNSYNPFPQEPTAFVEDAEEVIKVTFDEIIKEERDRWFREADELEKEINVATEVRDGFSDDIKRLRVDVKQNLAIIASLGKRGEYVDQRKLAEAVRRTRAGEEFETPTIDLTREGAARKVRITPRVLARQVEGTLDY